MAVIFDREVATDDLLGAKDRIGLGIDSSFCTPAIV